MNFKKWFLIEEVQKAIVYHGTTDKFSNSILASGLNPNPKQKTWEKDDSVRFGIQSRQSLEGIYVTSNLMTAISSGNNAVDKVGGEHPLVIIAQIVPQTMISDEDDLKVPIGNIKLDNLVMNEWLALKIWEEEMESPNSAYIKNIKTKYVEDSIRHLKHNINKNLHLSLEKRLRSLLYEKGFKAVLAQKAAHAVLDSSYSHEIKVEIPTVDEAEKGLLEFYNMFSKTFKMYSRPEYKKSNWNDKGRILSPIGYNTKNKIICIIQLIEKGKLKLIYGKPPSDFFEQWRKQKGYEIEWI